MSDSLSGTFSGRTLDAPADPAESLHKVKAVDRDTPREDADSRNDEQSAPGKRKTDRRREDRIELSADALRAAQAEASDPSEFEDDTPPRLNGDHSPFTGTA